MTTPTRKIKQCTLLTGPHLESLASCDGLVDVHTDGYGLGTGVTPGGWPFPLDPCKQSRVWTMSISYKRKQEQTEASAIAAAQATIQAEAQNILMLPHWQWPYQEHDIDLWGCCNRIVSSSRLILHETFKASFQDGAEKPGLPSAASCCVWNGAAWCAMLGSLDCLRGLGWGMGNCWCMAGTTGCGQYGSCGGQAGAGAWYGKEATCPLKGAAWGW